ncbi:MAG: hypothetical protein E6K80_04975 [Candidatus Eisenbacteria bacterium]|uniref:FlgD/Vpr Ig-like domain-containing protein n=1 Tax=Eiseniibacteriota bacterium TaxID=2212470 RepID=A0A538U6Z0_UNCEI|nr:MAG: hypothetical protein E6K80_04975 [Candidatus Eisenbacteria bacterium]
MPRTRSSVVIGLVLVAVAIPATADPIDPLNPLIAQAESFLHREESGGVTLDPRHFFSLPEHLRLTVVPQLAAFCDLDRANPNQSRWVDIVDRADFLVRLGPSARAFDASDGMMAFALLRAFEITGNTTYRDAAQAIVDGYLVAPVRDDPNRMLMAGLALAEENRLTNDPVARTRLTDILLLVARSQHADGSFDHVCLGARDVQYTAWIAMELDLIARLVEGTDASRIRDRAQAFLSQRVGPDGTIAYQDTLPSGPVLYYFSRPLCPSDYDTRGWVNELAYHALWLDRARDSRSNVMLRRLSDLVSQGAWPDKWAYFPNASDPSYVWSTAPRSVVRTSLVLWVLASIQIERATRGPVSDPAPSAAATAASTSDPRGGSEPSEPTIAWAPNPAHGAAWVLLRLPQLSSVRLDVIDASGRLVRALVAGSVPAGSRAIRWDGRDARGSAAAAGVYFVRMEIDGRARTARLAWIPAGR